MSESRKNMNILEVVESCGAGVVRHIRALCEYFAAEGHRVTVVYSPYRADEVFEQFMDDWQDRVHFVPIKLRREVSPASDLRGVVELLRLIRREGPFDVIHGHSSKAGAIARIVGPLFGIPTLYTPHSLILASPEISRLEAAVYGLVERALGYWATSKIIAVSGDERDFILDHRLVPNKRIVLIPNAIDDSDLQGLPERLAREDVGHKPLIFGAAMRFSAQKAPMNLVEAFVLLSDALPQVPMRLAIAGDGELFSEVEKRVEEGNLGDRVILPGWRSDTKEMFREFDVFVASSLYEGFSYSILEAMAAGLPIVTTDVFGTKETVSRVPGNAVVPAGSVAALAAGMRQLATLDKPESLRKELQSIGQSNYDYIRTRFRQSEMTRLTYEVYVEVCNARTKRIGMGAFSGTARAERVFVNRASRKRRFATGRSNLFAFAGDRLRNLKRTLRHTMRNNQTLKPVAHRMLGGRHQARLEVAALRTRLGARVAGSGSFRHTSHVNPENMVWIFGIGRSGTSWLRDMMREISNYKTWEEPLVGKLFGEFYDRERAVNLSRADFIMGNPTRKGWIKSIRNFVLDGAGYSHPSLGPEEFLVIGEHNGSIGAPLLMESLPESRMMLLIRDPRDVVASILDGAKRGGWIHRLGDRDLMWGQDTFLEEEPDAYVRQLAERYLRDVGAAKLAYDSHRGRKVVVKYEDLRADTLKTMRRIYSVLEMPVDEEELERAVAAHSWESIPEKNKGRGKFNRKATPGGWKADLTPEQVRLVEETTAPLLKEFYRT